MQRNLIIFESLKSILIHFITGAPLHSSLWAAHSSYLSPSLASLPIFSIFSVYSLCLIIASLFGWTAGEIKLVCPESKNSTHQSNGSFSISFCGPVVVREVFQGSYLFTHHSQKKFFHYVCYISYPTFVVLYLSTFYFQSCTLLIKRY